MHKNTDFHIEQTRLNDTYRKLNSGNDFSSYINEQRKPITNILVFFKIKNWLFYFVFILFNRML